MAEKGLDYVRGEAAGESARTSVAALIGADRSDVALIASVSAAAGLVAGQFGPTSRGQNLVIGEREYNSNHYAWRLLEHKGYEVRRGWALRSFRRDSCLVLGVTDRLSFTGTAKSHTGPR